MDRVFIARHKGGVRGRNRAQLVIISMRLSIRNLTTRKLHFADIHDAMQKVPSFTEGHDALAIELHVNRA